MTVNLSALAGAGQQFFTDVGVPLSGGKLYSYAAGTTTPQATYTTAAGSIAHANPIILDSAGRVSTGEIWLTAGSNYKFVLATSTNITLATWDNITGINGTGIASNASNVQYDPAGTGAVSTTVQAKLRQTISVQDYGAVGDGSTDDRAAIQNAINATPTGGTLYIPATASFYRINATSLTTALLVNKSMTIVLDGTLKGTTVAAQVNPPYIMNVTADNVTIQGIGTFLGTGSIITNTLTGAERPGLLRTAGANTTIDGINFIQYPEVAIFGANSNYLTVQNCVFKGYAVNATNSQYYAVNVESTSKGVRVLSNRFLKYDATHAHVQCVAMVSGTHYDVVISDNYVEESFDHFTYMNMSNSIISNNTVNQTVTGVGIKVNAGTGNVIENNTVISIQGGINLINASDTVVTGNKVSGFNFGYGVNVYDNTGGANALNNVTISDNIFVGDISGTTTDLYGGIYYSPTAASYNVEISNNILRNCGYSNTLIAAIQLDGAYQKNNVAITNNTISGGFNQTGIYVSDATNVNVSRNTLAIDSGTTALVNATGFANCTNIVCDGNYIIDNEASPRLQGGFDFPVSNTNYSLTNNTVYGLKAGASYVGWTQNFNNAFGNRMGSNPLSGLVTLDAAATTTVLNNNICNNSTTTNTACKILLTPLNAAAATLVSSSKSPFVSAQTIKTSFEIATADASAAAGTEIFFYQIIQ